MSTEALALSPAPGRRALNGPAMGARWSAVFYAGASLDEDALARRLQSAVDAVEAEMSPWRQDSDVERLNRAPVGAWTRLPRNLFQVIDAALEIGELSEGALDIGVGDLVKAWGLGAGSRSPNPDAIAALGGRPSFRPPQTLQLDPASRRARRLAPLRLDLSAIAKGFGVDELARVMTEFRLSSWLVGIDGELRAVGLRHDNRPWAVGHERPSRDSRALMGVIELRDCAVATSGNYRHVVEVGGRSVSHTMDPRRGAPLDNDLASVTVLAPTATAADAWATALMVLGGERGVSLAGSLGLRAVFVTHDGDVVASEGFDLGGLLKRRSACPTGHHAQHDSVASYKVMVESAGGVQAGKGEQGVGQKLVNGLGGMIDGRVRRYAEIQLEEAIVERAPMPDARHDADDGNGEHQEVEQVMHGGR